jgi:hypothetical protein
LSFKITTDGKFTKAGARRSSRRRLYKVGTNSEKPLVKEKHELMGEQARSFN